MGVPYYAYSIIYPKTLLHDCYVLLNKITRSRITHDNAVTIVARTIIPAICYPCAAVRPTKAQIENLRSKTFEATAFRKCQTQDAHIVFCEQTHLFDPESAMAAMVYHNMRFWRQVFIQAPLLAQQLKDMLEQSIPSKHDLYGPMMTIFQRDLDWLCCRFSTDADAVSNCANECILLTEPGKKKFEDFIREQIRMRFFQHL